MGRQRWIPRFLVVLLALGVCLLAVEAKARADSLQRHLSKQCRLIETMEARAEAPAAVRCDWFRLEVPLFDEQTPFSISRSTAHPNLTWSPDHPLRAPPTTPIHTA